MSSVCVLIHFRNIGGDGVCTRVEIVAVVSPPPSYFQTTRSLVLFELISLHRSSSLPPPIYLFCMTCEIGMATTVCIAVLPLSLSAYWLHYFSQPSSIPSVGCQLLAWVVV